MARANVILNKSAGQIEGFDYVMPLPSAAPFCAEFAGMVSTVVAAPVLEPYFLRKRQVGEVLADLKSHPPLTGRMRIALTSQLNAWEKTNLESLYQAKDMDVKLRPFVSAFALAGESPDIDGKKVLLVDDVFATGSSLASVREILENQLGASISAVFFLSGI